MQDSNSQGRQVKMWHWIDVLKVIINKKIKKPEQLSSDSFLTIY
jgi:hypothetical protein